ncbi:MAG TPA: RecX family transcriptional regulator, partial [Bacilli bacterium]
KWVQFELLQKGISKEHITEAIGSIETEDEFRCAMELAARRWGNMKGAFLDRKRKTMALLLRRGYTASLVNRVLKELDLTQTNDDSDNINDINY